MNIFNWASEHVLKALSTALPNLPDNYIVLLHNHLLSCGEETVKGFLEDLDLPQDYLSYFAIAEPVECLSEQ